MSSMDIEREDTIILDIQRSAHRYKGEVDELLKSIKEAENAIAALNKKLAVSSERMRESLDYLAKHHPEGAKVDWFTDMGTPRADLLRFEENKEQKDS